MTDMIHPLRIAIIGGGPGGLGAAIALSALPNVELALYEQARELREIGAGIRIGYNCWRVLELLGADADVKGHRKTEVLHRNGLTGNVLLRTGPSSLPLEYHPQRVRRTRLQSALRKQVPPGIIHLSKRLTSLENLPDGGVRLFFADGTEATADMVVGADGIRSEPLSGVSSSAEPLLRTSPTSPNPPPGGMALPAMRTSPPSTTRQRSLQRTNCSRFRWGIPATKERVEAHFTDYDPRVRETLSKVPEGDWKEFAAFAGPRLETLTAWDRLVLIGDASHPLTGAFGSGAAFALEDGWILARALEHTIYSTRSRQQALREALAIFDSIRSPYYLRMYQHLDNQKQKQLAAKATAKSFEDVLHARVASFSEGSELSWIYENDIEDVWKNWLAENVKSGRRRRDEGGISPNL
ncbi:Monooxygenase [Rasamsonia emersonii CBS 393.64]|uniref:Monooxygenase n=1 Tax=Rasamsonia emersonii (strain ATCC 16479 / CBS 393.64 / IMI 116815) TaxID=1408163 RepID=A0A0F4YQ93_RASE3|nr:Monooxygenase [Rasamsonia emersonii CBS 393.64]KKA20452.1 Monooxygenase [Rasamsonia emersonii CBS 393.64]